MSDQSMRKPPRRRVALRALPSSIQYVIALSTVAIVVAVAWHVGKDDPVPGWVSDGLVPVLAWVFIALLATTWVIRLLRRGSG